MKTHYQVDYLNIYHNLVVCQDFVFGECGGGGEKLRHIYNSDIFWNFKISLENEINNKITLSIIIIK